MIGFTRAKTSTPRVDESPRRIIVNRASFEKGARVEQEFARNLLLSYKVIAIVINYTSFEIFFWLIAKSYKLILSHRDIASYRGVSRAILKQVNNFPNGRE